MARFITLLDWDTDADVEINPEHIQVIRPTASDSDYQTTVYMAGIEPLKVNQTIAEIKEKIRAAG